MQHPTRGRLTTLLVAMIVTASGALSVNAAELDGTVESFVAVALERNPALQASKHQAEAARQSVGAHGVLPDPMLGFGYFLETPETRVGPQESAWMLNQRLPFFGKRSLDREVAARTADIADRSYERDVLELRYNVQRAFYEYYSVAQVASVLDEERELLKRMEQVAQVRYASGLVRQQDALKAQLSLSQVEDEIQVIAQRRSDVVTRLNSLLNRRPGTSLPQPLVADSLASVPPLDALLGTALQERPEVQSAQLEIDRAQSAHALAQREYFPDLTLGAQYIQVGTRDIPVEDNGKDIFQLNASINIPLWIGKRSAAAGRAEADAARARSKKSSWETRIANDVRDANERVRIARERVALYRDVIIPQATQTFRASEADYQTGVSDFLNYLDSERMLLSVRRKYFDVVADYGVQRALLERTVGGPLLGAR
jgi:cobalt-zinc-cadmium efflux system outer membrane protein